MTIHVMFDLETWGKVPGCLPRSIGACVFDPINGTLGEEFYRNISDRRDYGLTKDPETEKWWAEQAAEAQAILLPHRVDLAVALVRFAAWLDELVARDEISLWSHGPHFDEAILAAAYRAVGQPVPWFYRAPRDTRTIFEAAGWPSVPSTGLKHYSLDDARNQARAVIKSYQDLRLNRNHVLDRITELLEANNRVVDQRREACGLLRDVLMQWDDEGRHHDLYNSIETFISEIHQ